MVATSAIEAPAITSCPNGVEASPDGSRLYCTLESDDTVTVVDSKSGKVIKKIPLTANPNNVAMTPDGRKLYAAINEENSPGGVDVIDTSSLTIVKHLPLEGKGMIIHNTFVTPDGKFVAAASQDEAKRVVWIIDTQTDQVSWSYEFKDERDVIRPLAFVTNPDGSTKWILQELNNLAGFVVVDFATHKEITRVKIPFGEADLGEQHMGGANSSHGIRVSPDKKSVWVNSARDSSVYAFSLPDFKLIGSVAVGSNPFWMTFGPDGKKLYVATQNLMTISVVDTTKMKEVNRIPVGPMPKRSELLMLPRYSRGRRPRRPPNRWPP